MTPLPVGPLANNFLHYTCWNFLKFQIISIIICRFFLHISFALFVARTFVKTNFQISTFRWRELIFGRFFAWALSGAGEDLWISSRTLENDVKLEQRKRGLDVRTFLISEWLRKSKNPPKKSPSRFRLNKQWTFFFQVSSCNISCSWLLQCCS